MFVRQKSRSASPRRRPARKPSNPARRRKPPSRRRSIAPARIEQRHLDIAGLTLIAAGVYLAMVLWLGWDGGRVGSAANQGLSFVFGKVAYLIPVALVVSGGALILKPFLPAVRPLRTGGLCLLTGLLLAFAAQTAGLGPNRPPRPDIFDSSWFPHHGGVVGESLYWATSTLFQRIGAHLVAVLLIVAGGAAAHRDFDRDRDQRRRSHPASGARRHR